MTRSDQYTGSPTTVRSAVERAREEFGDALTFGDDVAIGIETLEPTAGPPRKILDGLERLHDLASELRRRSGHLGVSILEWLRCNGFDASGESAGTRNNRKEMLKRTWHDGHTRRPFELHLKPTNGTHPGRCARIYFAWDRVREKIIIGWVGQHP